MKGPTPRRLLQYVTRCLGLRSYFRSPGDGRPRPQIPAQALLWSVVIGQLLRASNFLAVERLVRSSARRALAVRIGPQPNSYTKSPRPGGASNVLARQWRSSVIHAMPSLRAASRVDSCSFMHTTISDLCARRKKIEDDQGASGRGTSAIQGRDCEGDHE